MIERNVQMKERYKGITKIDKQTNVKENQSYTATQNTKVRVLERKKQMFEKIDLEKEECVDVRNKERVSKKKEKRGIQI